MKTIKSMLHEAEVKQSRWEDIAICSVSLEERNKTKEQALQLANYFEGMADAFRDCLTLIQK